MNFHTSLVLRLVLIVGLLGLATVLAVHDLPYSAVFASLICVGLLAELFVFTRNRSLIYEKTILAMLHEDFSSDLPKNLQTGNYANLYKLYERQRRNQYQVQSRDNVFKSLLDTVDTAILILNHDGNDWQIFLMNRYFSNLFGVPAFRNWAHLREKIPALAEIIERSNFGEMKTSAEIRIDEQDLQTFSIQTSGTQSFHEEYYVIMLDSIQNVVERKEKQAWVNLMNVISHELLNSLTPIQSLSQS
ncbi:MAG: histidine kinase, partial [Proteobacteria bacterium]